MSVFTENELDYIRGERRLWRLATVGPDGTPHVAPVGMVSVDDGGTVEITGHNFAASKKFRDVARTGRAAIVLDDVLPPWQPRGIEVRGRAEAVEGENSVIRIHPTRIIGWGLDSDRRSPNARDVS